MRQDRIDLTPVLLKEFESARKAHEKALAKGDSHNASEMALKCARLLKKLAEYDWPERKAQHIESAGKWEALGKSIADGTYGKQKDTREKEGQAAEDELESYVEGCISSSPVTWNDIGGLEESKKLLKENMVIAVMKRPDSVKAWRGILLFGPPGTGKTLLAAAAAGSLGATFFNVSTDKVLSKYYGETSKLIAALFRVASRHAENAPSIVFIDEVDAIALSRSGEVSEPSRRALATLLSEMEGFRDKKTDKLVLTLAATNTPWDLDDACLRRFPKRIFVPLPDARATQQIIEIQTRGLDISAVRLPDLVQECVRRFYSGSDLAALCQQAVWNMIREANDMPRLSELPLEELKKMSLQTRPLSEMDFRRGMERIKTAVKAATLEKHREWAKKYGEWIEESD